LRDAGIDITAPVDATSRYQLVRHETVAELGVEPVFEGSVQRLLGQLIDERRSPDRLQQAGLEPTATALFVGPPGVGKTLAARFLAKELSLPLLTLDLSTVMSSFLGRTGSNLREVLHYARSSPSILLLDELDAVAKRRDDATEVGELKRLVTVLLQEIDDWVAPGLLIAATNHPDLLDLAVWRRFDMTISFELPGREALARAIPQFLEYTPAPEDLEAWACLFDGASFSDVERTLLRARRAAALSRASITETVTATLNDRMSSLSHNQRVDLARSLVSSGGTSQRRASQLTGISRDTIRKEIGGRPYSDTEAKRTLSNG
jgi:SpoVK/Ycf46/Vps4 family AAA+-type ATPase